MQRRASWIALVAVLALALVLLTALVGSAWAPLTTLDGRVADAAYAATAGHSGRTAAWHRVTTWGEPQVWRDAMVLVGAALVVLRRTRLGLWLVLLAAVESVVAPASKLVLERPRPVWADPIVTESSTSFPSGHATAAFTGAVAFVLLVGLASPARRVVAALAVLAACAVAASRVLLGVHYLSDVVGGALLGGLLAVVTWPLVVFRPRAAEPHDPPVVRRETALPARVGAELERPRTA